MTSAVTAEINSLFDFDSKIKSNNRSFDQTQMALAKNKKLNDYFAL